MKKIIITFFMLLTAIFPGVAMAEMVGALMPGGGIPYYETIHKTVMSELNELAPGTQILLQKPAPTEMAWKNATRKFSILNAGAVVAYGSATAACVVGENADLPVIYTAAYLPEVCGVTGNVTGMQANIPMEELIDNLDKITGFTKLAILYSPEEKETVKQMETIRELAVKKGAKVNVIDAHDQESFDFSGVNAVVLTSAAHINNKRTLEKIVTAANARNTATAAVLSGTCEMGVLISLAADPVHQGKGAARMVAQILDGKSPAQIPPDKSPEIEMTINLKTAKDLGVSIPFELLGKAKVVK